MGAETTLAGIRVRWQDVVPGRLGLWVPVRPDDLLEALSPEQIRAGQGRHLPYFGTLWPAGEALARHVLRIETLPGAVLDAGCGVGVVGLAALVRGARVAFLDWEPRSLRLVAHSAEALGVSPASLTVGDWRAPPPQDPFDRILAADVRYKDRNVGEVAAFLAAHLTARGEAWLADPGRAPAARFPAAARDAGLVLRETRPLPYRPRGIRVDCLRLARGHRPP